MTNSTDAILLTHTVHADISEDEARAAMPANFTVRRVVHFQPARLTFDETLTADWTALARLQRDQWEREIRPLLERYVGATVAYFGLSPIPLAIHLGSLTERWPAVRVFQRDHSSRLWAYAGARMPAVLGPSGANELVRSTDPGLVTISTTAPADVDTARQVVGPTSAELDIRTDPLGEDVLGSEDAVQAVAEKFRDALARLETNRPAMDEVHLVAAVPCGLAFLMGTYITPTRHARVVTYQYHRAHEPRLREALRLPVRQSSAAPLTDAETSLAVQLRASWEEERAKLAVGASAQEGPWWQILGDLSTSFERAPFGKLDAARDTPIVSPVDSEAATADEGFRFDASRKVWLLSDELLHSIRKHVAVADLNRAGRMLLLHESLHHGKQGLTSTSAPLIRLAPKSLEELDHRADVWAMLHEFAFAGLVEQEWTEQRSGLIGIIEAALRTMWAFDDDRERGILEVRRINRYLIWYTVLARIERAASSAEGMAILAEKPVVELIGPHVHMRDERLVAQLDGRGARVHELCLVDRSGRLRRLGNTNAVSVTALATALGAHDAETIRSTMRAFVEQE